MPSKKKTPKRKKTYSASSSGFHFYNLYQNCQRKFYLRYIEKLVPIYTYPPFIFGSAYHKGQEIFYRTHSAAKALRAVKDEILDREKEFEEPEMFKLNLERCPVLLERWIQDRGKTDLERYDIISVEDNIRMYLKWITFRKPNGKTYHPYITGRIDRIMRDKLTKIAAVYDTKTSTFSVKDTVNSFFYSEQAVQYLILGRHKYPELDIKYAVCDVSYWNYKSTGEHNISFVKSDFVYKTDTQLKQYLLSVGDLILEIAQKVEALKAGKHDPVVLFRRNTSFCYSFFRPCEYANICWTSQEGRRRIAGFKKDTTRRTICDHVEA